MAPFTSVLCAVDGSESAARVVRHAAGFAGVTGAHLTLVTVTDGDRREAEARLESLVSVNLPAGAGWLAEPRLRVTRITQGGVAEAILDCARDGVDLLVIGTHARGTVSRWLLGSTSEALLERTTCPTLLIPPGTADGVSLSAAEARLNVGRIMAAVDLHEANDRQLRLASELATLAMQPLVVMTVAPPEMTTEAARRMLAERARSVGISVADHLVVRRGPVAGQITQAAVQEPAGLLVMGLRDHSRGWPGEIAIAVLHAHETPVLTVPAI